MSDKKFLASIASAFLISTIIGLCVPVQVHRRDFDQAFSRWYRERTPAASLQLEAERRHNQEIVLETKVCGVLILFTICSGAWLAGTYLRNRSVTH